MASLTVSISMSSKSQAGFRFRFTVSSRCSRLRWLTSLSWSALSTCALFSVRAFNMLWRVAELRSCRWRSRWPSSCASLYSRDACRSFRGLQSPQWAWERCCSPVWAPAAWPGGSTGGSSAMPTAPISCSLSLPTARVPSSNSLPC